MLVGRLITVRISFDSKENSIVYIFLLYFLKYFRSEATQRQKKKVSADVTLELIASDVLDHYRTYSHLEKFLDAPQKLDSSLSFQLEKASKMHIIDQYYSLDDYVCRELLGKKLSSKYR